LASAKTALTTDHAVDPAVVANTARDAVETVVKIADAQSARTDATASSVNLGFKFGDDHLGVRVELRSGQVHTQFTTSSPELRDALSAQFTTLVSGSTSTSSGGTGGGSDRPYTFAAAEFSSAPGGGDQRGARQNSPDTSAESAVEIPAAGASNALGTTRSTTEILPAESAVGSLRLQAFA